MQVALKIWRYDPTSGERVLKDYEVEAPEWACLLDCLDIVKDQVDGTLAYRKSCRMMICGSCGMRMDGRAVLACKERMKPIVDSGHVPVISAMGNMPVLKDLVVDMGPFWSKIRAHEAVARDGLRGDPGEGVRRLAGADEPDPQGGALHHVRLLRLRVQLDGVRSRVLRARPRSRRASASSATRATVPRSSASRPTTTSTGSGTARAATSATSAAPRASTRATRSRSSAPSRSASASTATWARSTPSGSSTRPRRRAGCARPSSCRRRRG